MLLSVITVNYNDVEGLKYTSQSVRDFSCACDSDVEYIIIDGGSKDGSEDYLNDICNMHGFHEVKVISEPDNGIYDAMNKGLDNLSCESKYVIFMNSGDGFQSNASEVINKTSMTGEIEVFGINSKQANGELINIRRIKLLADIEAWPCFPHQSTFISSSYHRLVKYTDKYKILSDYDFFCKSYLSGLNINIHNERISLFAQGGVSNSVEHTGRFIHEIKSIQIGYFGDYNKKLVLTLKFKRFISMLPYSSVVEKIIRKFMLN